MDIWVPTGKINFGVNVKMRSINQIQIAVQQADPNITEEELRLCIEAQRNIEHFFYHALLNLINAIRENNNEKLLKMKAEFAWGTIERMFEAAKKTPEEWLGPDNIPGSPIQRKRLEGAKRLFEKVTGEKLTEDFK